ncbi:MAG: putative drug exporter of the superfamily [Nocardioidaceae bacterium]|nr:putative drug exporter of the superfamily [Nocardioidaceae bacterium]
MHRQIAGKLAGRRTKWAVLAFWVIVMVVAAPLAGKLMGAEKNDATSWLPGSAESTKALEKQAAFQSPNTLITVVVYEDNGGITPADHAKIAADTRRFAANPNLDGTVLGPLESPDHKAVQVAVPLNLGSDGWNKMPDIANHWRDIATTGTDMSVHITGPGGMAADSADAFKGIDGTLLVAAGAVVIIILLLVYRSPVLWLFPLMSALVALFSAEAVIYLLAKHAGLLVNAQSAGILTVLVFGAGTDYALLLIARYREELRRHHDKHEAMAVALHRAGPAIFASAGTVIVGMLCLMFAETNSTQGLGPVAAIGVAVGLLAMLTLLPALLVIFGRGLFWPRRPVEGSAEPTTTGVWAKVGRRISVRPRAVWGLTAALLAVASLGIFQLHASGLQTKDQFTKTVDSVVGEQVIEQHGFPGGSGTPVVVMTNSDKASQVAAAVKADPGIAGVTAPVARGGEAYVGATLASAPDSQAAYNTIDRLRTAVHGIAGADALVGGGTAVNLDVQRAAHHDRNLIVPLVLIVVLLILALLLRAIVAPLVLVGTVVLSFGAALGLSALAFKYVFGWHGADGSLPLFVFVFLVALGIDYNIFLMTRVKEEAIKYGTRQGALIGLAATGGVITSAGFVLAGTFLVLATLPLVAFAEIGFAVALGVLLDTIVVRSVLVTALNLDLGRHMWWPSALSRKEDMAPTGATEREEVLVE